ncbi:MAG TPA: thioredoxin family protein [Candidatus Omnitrophota bacterium]|nr:thioredoxin family protein [Candidatus Omnitrophota bacterium]
MMSIESIEVICLPCKKCEGLEKQIRQVVAAIGSRYKIVINFEYKHTKNLENITRYGLNATQTPALLINKIVEFAGKIDVVLLAKRLETIHKSC